MKKYIVTAMSVLLATSVYALQQDFAQVDSNKDGALSTAEARIALPEIAIIDQNKDDMVNQIEIEQALPGLMFSGDGKTKESRLVGATEYKQIVQALAELDNGKKKG